MYGNDEWLAARDLGWSLNSSAASTDAHMSNGWGHDELNLAGI